MIDLFGRPAWLRNPLSAQAIGMASNALPRAIVKPSARRVCMGASFNMVRNACLLLSSLVAVESKKVTDSLNLLELLRNEAGSLLHGKGDSHETGAHRLEDYCVWNSP